MSKSSENNKGLNDLFEDTLKDIYYVEKQIVRALPKMAKGEPPIGVCHPPVSHLRRA